MRISDWSSDVCSSDLVGRIAVAVLVPSHGGDREVTVQQIFRLDIAAPYPLGLIACAAIIGLSPGKTGIEEQVMPHFLLNADADPCIGPRQRPGANSRDIAAESIEGNRGARPDRIRHRRCELEAGIRLQGPILGIDRKSTRLNSSH